MSDGHFLSQSIAPLWMAVLRDNTRTKFGRLPRLLKFALGLILCLLLVLLISPLGRRFNLPGIPSFLPASKGELPENSYDGPQLVLILSYQKSGSTWLGDIFNKDEDIFYSFEPLDAVYVTLYGTQEGWNVPSDIFNYWNGSARDVAEQEHVGAAEVTNAILRCNVNVLPSEFLLHRFSSKFSHLQTRSKAYTDCRTDATGMEFPLAHCLTPLTKYCGVRFGHSEKAPLCLKYLLKVCHHATDITENIDAFILQDFKNYASCLDNGRHKLVESDCLSKLHASCISAKMRVAKTVRFTMEGVERLLRMNRNVKVIHLLRDPRAILLDRYSDTDESIKGFYSKGKTFLEAPLLCRQVAKDIIKRRQLELKYPNTFREIIFEQFAESLVDNTRDLFTNFLGANVSQAILTHLQTAQLSSTVNSWRSVLTFEQATNLTDQCHDVFTLTSTKYWP